MNLFLLIFSAIITTTGIIVIAEFAGRKRARYVRQFLAFLAIWPFLSIVLNFLLSMILDPDSAGEVSLTAGEQMHAMLPEFLLSGYIGEAVGFVVWGVYRWIKHKI
jgi:hypothetical protein